MLCAYRSGVKGQPIPLSYHVPSQTATLHRHHQPSEDQRAEGAIGVLR